MTAAELKCSHDIVYWIYEMTERRAVTRQKGEKIKNLTLAETLVFSPYACLGKPRDNSGRSGDTQENLT